MKPEDLIKEAGIPVEEVAAVMSAFARLAIVATSAMQRCGRGDAYEYVAQHHPRSLVGVFCAHLAAIGDKTFTEANAEEGLATFLASVAAVVDTHSKEH